MIKIQKIDRTGERTINTQGLEMTIIRYKNRHDIDVQFSDGAIAKSQYPNFLKGTILNHNVPSHLGVGYIGYGKYKTKINGVKTEEYIKWSSMLTRCYSEKLKQRENYIDCVVCDEWLNFQNFAEWYNNHKYYIPDVEILDLDKDIKFKGNKIYSPATCMLIPKRLNSVVLNRHNYRGDECVGVFYVEKINKYMAGCNMLNSKSRYLGVYNTELEAFNVYKTTKENEIKRVLELYKEYLPNDVYEAILNYRVEFND